MKAAVIGLGKIGRRVALQLYTKSVDVHCYDKNVEAMHTLATVRDSPTGYSNSLNCFKTPYQAVWKMPKPRVVLLFVPAGNAVDEVIYRTELGLAPNDVIVDCGNSHYKHSIQRAERLSKKGIGFLDAGF
ncbi:MAG: NAD(P)-binding domain-containing protein, partial [Candidatus Woesearchaeota archaeon]|nr:NAD(P)-binding domain-containing protein [Candidatus Woesearchaeota archaeon]